MKKIRKINKKYTATASINMRNLTKRGSSIDLAIYEKKEKLGTVIIGRGSIAWLGKNKQKPKSISWARFAEYMEGR